MKMQPRLANELTATQKLNLIQDLTKEKLTPDIFYILTVFVLNPKQREMIVSLIK